MKKEYVYFAAVVMTFAAGYWAFRSMTGPVDSDATRESGKIRVLTTLFPLYDFAREVGGERVEVTLIVPPGVEPHSFEPKPSDLARIDDADIFLYTGDAMEPWVGDVVANLDKSVLVVDASDGIDLMVESEEDEHSDGDHHEEEHSDGHHHGDGTDPHFWLDFDNASKTVGAIADALVRKDAANKDGYERSAEAYREKLRGMDDSYRKTLSQCRLKRIVYGGHYAFGYLARRYGLEYVAAQGFSPDSEPTAKDMADLVEQVRGEGLKYIFYEELTSPKIAETIALETDAQLLLLSAAHNVGKDDIRKERSFLDIMEDNRLNLSKGLECL